MTGGVIALSPQPTLQAPRPRKATSSSWPPPPSELSSSLLVDDAIPSCTPKNHSRHPKSPAGQPKSPSRPPSRPPSRTERRFACTHPGCEKAYFKPSRLSEHELTHTGERPHACTTCDQTYLRASHLAAHMRTHRDDQERAFACSREGCEKRFWTATHLRRHETSHDEAEVHECSTCHEVFSKNHLLREHFALAHLPPGSKPFVCSHSCGKTFATKQQLRTHEKTHDPTRYICSHPSHKEDLPTFPVWSALQAHIREAHPPTCPHPECSRGRTFKSAQRLREHLRVHAERDADLELAKARSLAGGNDLSDLPAVLAEGLGFKRRRKRRLSEADSNPSTPSTPTTPRKLPRVLNGETGKVWSCGVAGCVARFKTRFARDEHSSAAHVRIGKHRCEQCGRTYRRQASLRRHVAKAKCGEEDVNNDAGGDKKKNGGGEPLDTGSLLTGAATLKGGQHYRRWACPLRYGEVRGSEDAASEFDSEALENMVCSERFHRVYDVRRHLASAHQLKLDDMGVRELLLADGQNGDSD